jgi:TDG/mug DNA glycosylase family protein
VAVLGVTAFRDAFADPKARVGPQQRRLAGTRVWVLPNPSGLNAHYQIDDLAREFSALREETTR